MVTLAQDDLKADFSFTGLALPITVRPPAPVSDDDLFLLSQHNQMCQIERNARGELEIMSPTGGKGGRWESRVIRDLDIWAEDNGGSSFSSSTGFRLPDGSVLMPDAAWISDARWDALSDRDQRKYPPLCPDFVIGVLSETESRPVLEVKMYLWIDNGAQLAWMIDPYAQTVSVYRPDRPAEELAKPESVEAGEPVIGFRLNLASLWQR